MTAQIQLVPRPKIVSNCKRAVVVFEPQSSDHEADPLPLSYATSKYFKYSILTFTQVIN